MASPELSRTLPAGTPVTASTCGAQKNGKVRASRGNGRPGSSITDAYTFQPELVATQEGRSGRVVRLMTGTVILSPEEIPKAQLVPSSVPFARAVTRNVPWPRCTH